ncbi:methylated-DNA--protein-cysteine methyltransferase isoform X4 [Struthio camelus]|uniref:methylated-DNA--protein-cysteine methyltransferase isoform X4 n=1 Tax=Struthio camelus TaxID=8801 RepID=UPI00360428CF
MIYGKDLPSTMASRFVPKATSKNGESQCKVMHAVLHSPVGKIEISGCETGLHEIKLPKMNMPPNRRRTKRGSPTLPPSECSFPRFHAICSLFGRGKLRAGEAPATCEVGAGAGALLEPLEQCVAWLRAYFCEPALTASLPVPAFHHPVLQRASFTRQVLWTLLNDVKFGEAISYKQLAALAGNSKAARAVGGAMRSNPIPIIIPCHRVIRSSGETGNYGGGNLMKEWLLSHEKLQKEKLAY